MPGLVPGTEPKTIRSPPGVNLKMVPGPVGLLSSLAMTQASPTMSVARPSKKNLATLPVVLTLLRRLNLSSPNVMVVGLNALRCEKIAEPVQGNPMVSDGGSVKAEAAVAQIARS
jgi:hypothetical protein